MTTFLLDVNVLIALFDDAHIHHEAAHAWWKKRGNASWATCPLTENGFVRIASHPRYPNSPGDSNTTLELLREFCAGGGHMFWSDEVSLRECLVRGVVLLHNQITDIYLSSIYWHLPPDMMPNWLHLTDIFKPSILKAASKPSKSCRLTRVLNY